MRVYLSIAATGFGAVAGFGTTIDSGNALGIRFNNEGGKLEWKWRDVGMLLQGDLLVDDGGFGTSYWIEEVENWPAKTTRREIEARSRTRSALTFRNLRRRVQQLQASNLLE